jgi:hypothetical protein
MSSSPSASTRTDTRCGVSSQKSMAPLTAVNGLSRVSGAVGPLYSG